MKLRKRAAADPGNPQTFNAYAYVANNPLVATDALGLCGPQGCMTVPTGPFCWNTPQCNISAPAPPPISVIPAATLQMWIEMLAMDYGVGTGQQYAPPAPPSTSGAPAPKKPQQKPCALAAPAGNYQVANGVDARFNPVTAQMVSNALANLNRQDIDPVITSGYRPPSAQAALLTVDTPFVVTPAKISWHEAGAAVDLGPNSNAGNFPAIVSAMTQAGFVWGGTFSAPDVPHFQSEPAGTSPSAATVQACAAAASGD